MADRNDWERNRDRSRDRGEGGDREREPRWTGERREWEERRDQPWAGENRERIVPERPNEYSGRGDWGPQGSWGTFGNRADWRHERDWENAGGDWAGERGDRDRAAGHYTGGMGSFGGGMATYGGRGRFSGRGPKNWQRSDERILEDVNERLTDHPDIDATDIEVQVNKGEVTLTGAVEDRSGKRLAEDIAAGVSGVRDVHNQLRIQSGAQSPR